MGHKLYKGRQITLENDVVNKKKRVKTKKNSRYFYRKIHKKVGKNFLPSAAVSMKFRCTFFNQFDKISIILFVCLYPYLIKPNWFNGIKRMRIKSKLNNDAAFKDSRELGVK